ncbi:hypothetical protein VMCG_05339 [Cytospora schulzeri]|uniref:Uncharacterized protein n=1 Tax=Cytospora schulzeri TaxID=448051 RepID=A0A423WK24_9PEZI|nr:hypothetical protein VMCG_05339 [Valsa malicola]
MVGEPQMGDTIVVTGRKVKHGRYMTILFSQIYDSCVNGLPKSFHVRNDPVKDKKVVLQLFAHLWDQVRTFGSVLSVETGTGAFLKRQSITSGTSQTVVELLTVQLTVK